MSVKQYIIPGNDVGYPTDEALRLVENIDWKSCDKDNMEFEARITCYQRDALRAVLSYVYRMY